MENKKEVTLELTRDEAVRFQRIMEVDVRIKETNLRAGFISDSDRRYYQKLLREDKRILSALTAALDAPRGDH